MSPRVIVSTCGTSILTNRTDYERRDLIVRLANCKEGDLTPEDKQTLDQHIRERKQMVQVAEDDQIKSLSAELNGILTYYADTPEPAQGVPDLHVLITSDTYLGQRVGEIIKSWMHDRGLAVLDVWKPSGLVANDRDSFHKAMAELVHNCETLLEGYRKRGDHVAFNLTGGFKSAQGFLQAFGMFYADESFYIFETGSLLTIPRLPITLDIESVTGEHGSAFRRLGLGEVLPAEECEDIPETLLFQLGQEAEISEWGKLVWERGKKKFYSERPLLDDPLPGLRYTRNFIRKVEKWPDLTPNKLATLNERLDQLSLVVRRKRDNLKGLDLKKLKGDPCPPATHECDIWSGEEYRLFGHYKKRNEENNFVLDNIGRGIHKSRGAG